MEYDLKDLKKLRGQLGLNQQNLAKNSGVSQSLIAKIESGKIDPSYSNAKKIFSVIDSLKLKNQKLAKDVMNPRLVQITSRSTIKSAILKMREHSISQLPVIDNNFLVGIVSESILMDALTAKKSMFSVKEIMEDGPPTISKNASMDAVFALLKYYPAVIVMDKSRPCGIITKSDILNKFY